MKRLLRFAIPLLLLVTMASAGTIFDRRLDPTHLMTWAPAGTYILGDDLGFGGFTQSGTIDSMTVWMVGENTGTTNPNQETAGINLYLGLDPGPLNKYSSYTFVPDGTFANPTLHINQPIFALTFSGLNYSFPAFQTVDFAVEGLPPSSGGPSFALASLTSGGACVGSVYFSGLPAETPCDQVFVAYTGVSGTGPYNVSFGPSGADINVLVDGSTIPEPATYTMVGLGLLGVMFARRRRR